MSKFKLWNFFTRRSTDNQAYYIFFFPKVFIDLPALFSFYRWSPFLLHSSPFFSHSSRSVLPYFPLIYLTITNHPSCFSSFFFPLFIASCRINHFYSLSVTCVIPPFLCHCIIYRSSQFFPFFSSNFLPGYHSSSFLLCLLLMIHEDLTNYAQQRDLFYQTRTKCFKICLRVAKSILVCLKVPWMNQGL